MNYYLHTFLRNVAISNTLFTQSCLVNIKNQCRLLGEHRFVYDWNGFKSQGVAYLFSLLTSQLKATCSCLIPISLSSWVGIIYIIPLDYIGNQIVSLNVSVFLSRNIQYQYKERIIFFKGGVNYYLVKIFTWEIKLFNFERRFSLHNYMQENYLCWGHLLIYIQQHIL